MRRQRWPDAGRSRRASSAAPSPEAERRALAELMVERHGILTRPAALAEGVLGGFAAPTRLWRTSRPRRPPSRYFLEGLGGAQFAMPGAVERL